MIRLIIMILVLSLSGCSSVYYSAMEKVGVHKRDIMIDRVEEMRDSQLQTSEQFSSALERFRSVIAVESDLADKYDELKDELERSEEQAEDVRERIAAVEDVSEALFDEWQDELSQYSSAKLRRSSEQKLKQTRSHYKKLISAMKRAEAKIDPVLAPMRDQVLYLKHNLNAKAIASLQSELVSIEADVARLLKEMEISIKAADAFIVELQQN